MRFKHLVGLPIRTEQQIDENVVGDANFCNLAVCCRYKPRRTNILRRGQNASARLTRSPLSRVAATSTSTSSVARRKPLNLTA